MSPNLSVYLHDNSPDRLPTVTGELVLSPSFHRNQPELEKDHFHSQGKRIRSSNSAEDSRYRNAP